VARWMAKTLSASDHSASDHFPIVASWRSSFLSFLMLQPAYGGRQCFGSITSCPRDDMNIVTQQGVTLVALMLSWEMRR
jgi:hypothetical protein